MSADCRICIVRCMCCRAEKLLEILRKRAVLPIMPISILVISNALEKNQKAPDSTNTSMFIVVLWHVIAEILYHLSADWLFHYRIALNLPHNDVVKCNFICKKIMPFGVSYKPLKKFSTENAYKGCLLNICNVCLMQDFSSNK